MSFGFSAGDFITALELVTTLVNALRDSGGSSAEYQALISQLYTLENALLRVKQLELDESQHAEVIALRQAAAQCQRTIDGFWEKIKKYQPSLRAEGSGSRVKDAWRKVKWAVCKKDDLVKFKADLMAHTESIELLLTTVQMAGTRIEFKKNEENYRSLVGKVQDSYFGCMRRMTVLLERASMCVQQGKQLLEMTAKIIETNVLVFQIVLNIQHIITRIPGQINRQQPVYFVDALGRPTPFHLEFIMCAESLLAVLKNNFRNIGSASLKIEKGEFALQDSATNRDIDLGRAWEVCFWPGQQVSMSMVFDSAKALDKRCPTCRQEPLVDFANDSDTECPKCKMIYRCSVSSPAPLSRPSTAQISRKRLTLKRRSPPDDTEEMALFRRIRLKTSTTKTVYEFGGSSKEPSKINYSGVRMLGMMCPTCAANGQEVWVIPGRLCSYCGTSCS